MSESYISLVSFLITNIDPDESAQTAPMAQMELLRSVFNFHIDFNWTNNLFISSARAKFDEKLQNLIAIHQI